MKKFKIAVGMLVALAVMAGFAMPAGAVTNDQIVGGLSRGM
jgi:hypothetical protein